MNQPVSDANDIGRDTLNLRRLRNMVRGIVAVMLSAVIAATTVELYAERSEVLENAHRETATLAETLAENTRYVFDVTDLALQLVAQRVEEKFEAGGIQDAELDAFVSRVARQTGAVENIFVIRADGTVAASSADSVPANVNFADRTYFQAQRDNAGTGLFVGGPIKGRVQDIVVVPISRRIAAPGGGFGGVVLATIGPSYFTALYTDLDIGPRGVVLLAHEDGTVIARVPPDDTIGTSFAGRPLFQEHVKAAPKGTYLSPPQSDGEVRITGYQLIEPHGLVVAVAIHRGELLRPWYRHIAVHVAAILVLVVFLAGALFYSEKLLRRERDLLSRLSEGRQRYLRRSRQQQAVSILSERADTTDDAEDFLREAATLAAETLNVEFCQFLQAEPDGNSFRTVAAHGWTDESKVAAYTPEGDFTHAGKCLQLGEPLVTGDYAAETRFKPSERLIRNGVCSGITVPLRLTETERGVLGVHATAVHAFHEDDVVFLQSIGYVVANYFERLWESRFRKAVLDGVSANICVLTMTGRILMVNEGWREFARENGFDVSASWTDMNYLDICNAAPEPEAEWIGNAIRYILDGEEEQFAIEYPCHSPDEARWFRALVSPVQLDQGRGAIVMHVDITKLVEAEHDAIRSQNRLETLIREAKVGILVHSDFKPLVANEELARIFGFSHADEILAMEDIRDLFAEEERENITAYYTDRVTGKFTPGLYPATGVRRDGAEIHLENRAFPIDWGTARAVCAMITDVTEQRLLEERVREAQRLEAIGQLTGGIAHDFNNLLTVILGNADALVTRLAGDETGRKLAEISLHAARRGGDLTRRLLAFARRQPLDPKRSDIGGVLAGIDGLLKRTIGEDIELRVDIEDGLWPALVDVPQLEASILNLCINARDAMPDGGYLTIEAQNVRLDRGYAEQHADIRPGRYVMLAVTDTGTGMDEETTNQAVLPFFTTKEVGQGTGLGLSMVFGFAKQSNGHLSIYSEVGHGTTVRLYLPEADGDAQSPEPEDDSNLMPTTGARILLVEDDDLVRMHIAAQLEELGCVVTPARNGSEALDILGGSETFDLLFTDVVMPGGMNGKELADRAAGVRPDLPVLFTTGYAENALHHQGRLEEGVHLLQKPYTLNDLSKGVTEAIARPWHGSGTGPDRR